MFKSVASKIISISIGIFVVVLAISTFANYKQTSSETIEVYEGLQKLALNSSYLTIDITMNRDANNQLSGLAKLLSTIERNDYISQRKTFLNLARFMDSPLVFVVYENDGKLISVTAKTTESELKNSDDGNSFDFRQREWYQKAKATKKFVVSDPYISKVAGYEGIIVTTTALPIFKDGRFIGVIGANVIPSTFQQRFNTMQLRELPSLEVLLVDSKGSVFVHKDLNKENQAEFNELGAQILAQSKANPQGRFETTFGGNKKVVFYNQMPFGWIIATEANESDFVEVIHQSFLTSMGLAILLLILGGVALLFVV